MTNLQIGDTVRLKSGGPVMTITSKGQSFFGRQDTHFYCTWFTKDQERREEEFAKESLEKCAPRSMGSYAV